MCRFPTASHGEGDEHHLDRPIPSPPGTSPEPEPGLTCSSKPASGVEHRVSSLERSRMESRQSGVRGAESSSGLMGLRGEWLWGSSGCERQLPTSGDAGCGVEGFPS